MPKRASHLLDPDDDAIAVDDVQVAEASRVDAVFQAPHRDAVSAQGWRATMLPSWGMLSAYAKHTLRVMRTSKVNFLLGGTLSVCCALRAILSVDHIRSLVSPHGCVDVTLISSYCQANHLFSLFAMPKIMSSGAFQFAHSASCSARLLCCCVCRRSASIDYRQCTDHFSTFG